MPINGTVGNDSIDGTGGNDEINGFDGNDTLNGLAGNDTIHGDAGSDSINGGPGDDFLLGGVGNDTLNLGVSGDGLITFDQARGGTGDDLLIGGAGGPTLLTGGAGNDTLDGSQGTQDEADYFDVGFGLDGGPVQAAGDVAGVNVNLATGLTSDDGEGGVDTLIGIENVRGSSYNDTIVGDAGNNGIFAGAGDDSIQAGDGNDFVGGGNGNDSISGGSGVDFLNGAAGDDQLFGGAGVDFLYGNEGDDEIWGGTDQDFLDGGRGNDTLDGGDGQDIADFRGGDQGAVIDLVSGTASNDGFGFSDVIFNVEDVFSTQFSDLVTLNDSSGGINSFAGDDTLVGGLGDNFFYPGSGNDTIHGGGSGNNTLIYQANGFDSAGPQTRGVQADLAAGTATDPWGDIDSFTNIQNITGSNLNDTIVGDAVNNIIEGGTGDDILRGEDGSDTLHGGIGNDQLVGGNGDDIIDNFGGGIDTLTGGAGNDVFFFDSIANNPGAELTNATITDLEAGDTISLSETDLAPQSFDDVLNASTQVGSDVVIDLGNGASLTLQNILLDELSPIPFGFPPVSNAIIGTDGDDIFNNDGDITSIDVRLGNDIIVNSGTIINQTDNFRDFAITSAGGDLTVVNSGTIIAGDDRDIFGLNFDLSVAISHTSSGTLNVTNEAGGLIDGGRMAIETLNTASGAAPGFATIVNDGTVISGDDAIRARGGVDLTNNGTITGTGTAFIDGVGNPAANGSDGIAIFDSPAGTIDPAIISTITNNASGVIEGYRGGINFGLQGTLNNAGHIEGGDAGVLVTHDGVAITNSGTIVQTNEGPQGGGVGGIEQTASVYAVNNTVIDNSGTITGVNHGIGSTAAVNITNSGTITGDSDSDGTGDAILTAQLEDFLVDGSFATSLGPDDSIISGLLPDGFVTDQAQVPVLFLTDEIGDGISVIVAEFAVDPSTGNFVPVVDQNGNIVYADVTTSEGSFSFPFDPITGTYLVRDANGDRYFNIPDAANINDTIINSGTINGDIDLGIGNDTVVNSGTINGNIALGDGDDSYSSTDGGTVLSIDGGAGNDTLQGNSGDDRISGGTGADVFVIDAVSSDTIFDFSAGDNDIIDLSGQGLSFFDIEDVLAAASEAAGITTIDLGNGNSLSLEGVSIDDLTTNSFIFSPNNPADNDEIKGTKDDDAIDGSIGHDTLDGDKGSDTLGGGAGNDILIGGKGDDQLSGGTGRDELNGGKGNDQLDGGEGNDWLNGGKGDDVFIFSGNSGDDVISEFSVQHDSLDISGTAIDFTDLASVEAAATETIVAGVLGVLLDLGDGNSLFVEEIGVSDLASINFIY